MKIKNSECPDCLAGLDGATCLTGKAVPKPGDYTVCSKCGCMLKFDQDLNVERLSPDEIADYGAKYPEEAAALQHASRLFKKVVQLGGRVTVLDSDQLVEILMEIITEKKKGPTKPKRRFQA